MTGQTELAELIDALDSAQPDAAATRHRLAQLRTDNPAWRLHAADLLATAGATQTAIGLVRSHVLAIAAPDADTRRQAEAMVRLAIRLGDAAPLERYLRLCHGAEARVAIGDPGDHAQRAVVQWRLDAGRSTFIFSPRIGHTPFSTTALKHFAWALPMLLAYALAHPHVSGAAWLSLEDEGYRPGLAWCDFRPDYFLLPDPIFLGSDAYRVDRAAFDAAARPWTERTDAAYWRGATTGWHRADGDRVSGWQELPRIVLCCIARTGPAAALLNCAVTELAQLTEQDAQEVRQSGLLGPPEPPAAMLDYRYQIDVDGNTNAWRALFLKLYSGGPVLKVQSPRDYRQWYYDRLQPWSNFVPVAADMADLHEKLLWLRDHPNHAEAIGRRGQALARSLLAETEIRRAFPVIEAAFRHASYQRHAQRRRNTQGPPAESR